MKNFYSCLFPVFQELYDSIIHGVYPIVDSPEHVTHFMEALNADSSQDAVSDAVIQALKEANSCKLCTDCKKCSNRFYLAVAEKLIDDYQDSEFSRIEAELQKKYGAISFRKIPQQLKIHLENHDTMKEHYVQQSVGREQSSSIENKLIMLKGMSSSSPYIYNNVYNTNHYTGGGFYININGFGIAVDPGYGFVENMHKNKIGIHDINAVIITHFHLDHTSDMRIIDDLNYQFNKGKTIPSINWYLDETSYDILYKGYDKENNIPTVITPERFNTETTVSDDITLYPFHTIHVQDYEKSTKTEIVYKNDTYGFVLTCTVNNKDFRIGYTSDTRYFNGLENHLENCDIIIANISGIYPEDYLFIKEKANHLGYMGCFKLLQNINNRPKIAILSEFWNGTTDIRFDTCRVLADELEDKVRILPGEIGMNLDFTRTYIKCSQCGKYDSINNIRTIRPHEDFDKIMYICSDCMY